VIAKKEDESWKGKKFDKSFKKKLQKKGTQFWTDFYPKSIIFKSKMQKAFTRIKD